MRPAPTTALLGHKLTLLAHTHKGSNVRFEGVCVGFTEVISPTFTDTEPHIFRLLMEDPLSQTPVWYGISTEDVPDPDSHSPWVVENVE